MGNTIEICLFMVAALSALGQSANALSTLASAANTLAANFSGEYALRGCGQIAAAQANLADAADFLAARYPALAPNFHQSAALLAKELWVVYGPNTLAFTAGQCQAPRRDSSLAASSGDSPSFSAVFLHRQHHEGQPLFWPNWVVRFASTPTDK